MVPQDLPWCTKIKKCFDKNAKVFQDFRKQQNSSAITDELQFLQDRLGYFMAVLKQQYLPSIANKLINIESRLLIIVFYKIIKKVPLISALFCLTEFVTEFNSFTAEVPIIQKLVQWFALQINGLVSILRHERENRTISFLFFFC